MSEKTSIFTYKKSGDTTEFKVDRVMLVFFVFIQLFILYFGYSLWENKIENSGVLYADGSKVSCRSYISELNEHQEYLRVAREEFPEKVKNACEVHCGDFLLQEIES